MRRIRCRCRPLPWKSNATLARAPSPRAPQFQCSRGGEARFDFFLSSVLGSATLKLGVRGRRRAARKNLRLISTRDVQNFPRFQCVSLTRPQPPAPRATLEHVAGRSRVASGRGRPGGAPRRGGLRWAVAVLRSHGSARKLPFLALFDSARLSRSRALLDYAGQPTGRHWLGPSTCAVHPCRALEVDSRPTRARFPPRRPLATAAPKPAGKWALGSYCWTPRAPEAPRALPDPMFSQVPYRAHIEPK